MSIEQKAGSEYAKNATSEAKSVNGLITFFRTIWASTFFISAYILYVFETSNAVVLLLVVNGLLSLKTIQNLLFESYGGGKLAVQYIILIGGLTLALA